MKSKVNKTKINKSQIFLGITIFEVIIFIAINPAKYSSACFKGLEVWAKILVPSLLPFFILSKLFSATNMIEPLTSIFEKPMAKLYHAPKQASYVFFMSIITGYPVGSKLICDLYNANQITRSHAVKMTSFSSNSGPMFILGSVAIGMFANKKMGIVILISHILGALINGIFYRNIKLKETDNINKKDIKNNNINFSDSISSSISSVLLIGGVVGLSFVILELITTSKIFTNFINLLSFLKINSKILTSIFCGIFEITKGCLMLSSCMLSQNISTLVCTFVISFGGISTLLQAMTFLKDIVPTKIFLLQKITHAICSAFVCSILLLIL